MSQEGVQATRAAANSVNGVYGVNGANGVNVSNGANTHLNGNQKSDQVSYEAIIVGAGFAGLRELYELRKRGVSARVFDAAGGVGGVSLTLCTLRRPVV